MSDDDVYLALVDDVWKEIDENNPKSIEEVAEIVNKIEDSDKGIINEEMTVDDENVKDASYESRELEYDELDIDDIDDDFNKIIHKRKLIDESILDSVEAMQVDDIKIDTDKFDADIELPEIKIKKDMNEDIW